MYVCMYVCMYVFLYFVCTYKMNVWTMTQTIWTQMCIYVGLPEKKMYKPFYASVRGGKRGKKEAKRCKE